MKKLLSILSVITIMGTSLPSTIAASNYKKEKINDNNSQKFLNRTKRENNDKFLPKLIKNTKLGLIPTNSEESILDQVVRLNRNINRNDISVARIVHNQAQIVLRETIENNGWMANNFIWITFETNPEVEIKVGNSIFYHNYPRYYDQSSLLNNYFKTKLNTLNIGIIPDNRGTTILEHIREQIFLFGNLAEQIHELTLSNITSSTAVISLQMSERYREEFLVTFTPQRIDLNSIITINDLGTVNNLDVLDRITELYPQLRNEILLVSFVSPTVAEIFVRDDNPLYLGRVLVSFKNNAGDKINKKENKSNEDDDHSDNDKKNKPLEGTKINNHNSIILKKLNSNWDVTGPITDDKKTESKQINLIKWSDYATSLQEFKEKYKHIKFNDFAVSAGGQGTTVSNKTNIEFNTEKLDDTKTYKENIKYYFLNYVPMPFINYVEQYASLYIKNLFFEGEYLKASIISYTYSWMAVYHVWTKLKIDSVEFY